MRRILILGWSSFLFLICLTFSARAQNINITLVSQHEPANTSIAFGDVWAEGDLACLGIWTGYSTAYGVGIYNISNPGTNMLKSIYASPTSSFNQFELGFVRNKIGYFGSWSGGGVHIVNLTNALTSTTPPPLLSQIGSAGGGHDRVHTVFLERNFLYEAAHVAGVNTVKVIDVSDPFAPFLVRDIICTNASKVHQITAVKKGTNTILYTSDFGTGSTAPGYTHIWDVSNIGSQPAVWLGNFNSGGSSHSSWPTPDGNTLVVCRETTGGDVRLYDISNPASPVLQTIISPATMGLPSAIPHNPVVVSNLLFLSWYQNGINIFDITDRTKPIRIGAYDTYTAAASGSFQGNWGVFPNLGLNRLLLSDIQTGFYILDASAVLTATNNYPPLLVQQPTSLTATQGTTATLSSFVTGSSIKYQWRSGSVTTTGTPVSSGTNSSLVFSNVQTSNSTNYFVIATNSLGAVTSSVVSLSVTVPQNLVPTITAQPQPASVYPESDANFSVALSGSAPFTFQWRFNGVDLSGATTNTLTISNAQPEQVGNYSVFITNSYGTATSSNAMLTLIDSPYLNTIQATPGMRSALISWKSTVPSDSQVQFSVATSVIQSPSSMSAMGASFGSSSYIDRKISTNHTILLTGLTPNTRYSFQVISSGETNTYLSGVYQFTTAGTIIIDNPEAAFTGTWTLGNSSLDKYGVDYQFASSVVGSNTATATFRPNLSTTGKYDVHIFYPQGSNRANNTPFTIFNNGGSTIVYVNQQSGGGAWRSIGANMDFDSGNSGYVRVANNANPMVVLADAVRFTYLESQDFPTGPTVPTWWENFYFGGPVDPLADPDGDGYSTAEEYAVGTSPIAADSHLQLDLQSSGGAANITFWPYLGNRNYQLLFKTNLTDASWQILSPGGITPTPYGHGIFSLSTDNASQGFYRLVVQPTIQGSFSGKIALPQADAFSGFSEAACGVNRIFVQQTFRK
ncbi:MAG: immunoglobulin domain-containing protein [Verrucomicrobiota bacterium]